MYGAENYFNKGDRYVKLRMCDKPQLTLKQVKASNKNEED